VAVGGVGSNGSNGSNSRRAGQACTATSGRRRCCARRAAGGTPLRSCAARRPRRPGGCEARRPEGYEARCPRRPRVSGRRSGGTRGAPPPKGSPVNIHPRALSTFAVNASAADTSGDDAPRRYRALRGVSRTKRCGGRARWLACRAASFVSAGAPARPSSGGAPRGSSCAGRGVTGLRAGRPAGGRGAASASFAVFVQGGARAATPEGWLPSPGGGA